MKELTLAHKKALSESVKPNGNGLDTALLNSLINAPSGELQMETLTGHVRTTLASLLRLPEDEVGLNESSLDLGLDSLVGLECKNSLEHALGVELPLNLILQGPTVVELSAEIAGRLDLSPEKPMSQATLPSGKNTGRPRVLTDYVLDKRKWILGRAKKRAKLRLYCFPYCSQSGSIFRNWVKNFPSEIEVRPIELPGRGRRLAERPIEYLDEMARRLTEVIGKDLDRPYALFGHSAGALMAYHWSRYLLKMDQPLPQQLIVSAYSCPTRDNPILASMKGLYGEVCGGGRIPTLDEVIDPANTQMVERLLDLSMKNAKELGLRPNAVKGTRALLEAQLFASIATLRMVDTLDLEFDKRLPLPIIACHGRDDRQVTLEEMQDWGGLTSKKFTLEQFDGDHLFVDPEQAEETVMSFVCSQLLARDGEIQS